METLSAGTPEEGNPSSVKSEDSTPPHESGRTSPPPNCAICLGTCKNKCFTDSCLHQFCFKCLLTWSKVKAECPLCKQNFKSIIHNVRSNHQYEEYMVEQRETEESPEQISLDGITAATEARRFRYRTTLTLPRHESLAIQRFLLHYPMVSGMFPGRAPPRAPPARRRRRSPASFRRTVYRHNLWARPLPDFTGRYRDCSPEFYRYNDSQMHRLVPWLNRELHYLLNENVGHISYVMARILELLQQYHVNSAEFTEAMQRYFGDRTEHFLHELYCFASTPYDMTGYDRNVQYTTDTRISTIVNEVISSSESEASVDSDIVMVSSSGPAEPPPGPSRLPAPAYPAGAIAPVIPIETISQSGSDDSSSEVMLVGYIKPPQDRTPEVVDLLGSDSDVIVQDAPAAPEPAPALAPAPAPAPAPLVKLSLSRPRAARPESDSDSSGDRPSPPARPRRKRRRSARHAGPAPAPEPEPELVASEPDSSGAELVSERSSRDSSDSFSGSTGDSSSSEDHRKRAPKRAKRKSDRQRSEDKKRSKRNPRSSRKDETKISQAEKNRRSKRKSHSGKGVKRSKRTVPDSASPERDEEAARPEWDEAAARPGPSASRERRRRRLSRETKRLKSVVNVMNGQKNSSDSSSSGNSNLLSILNSAILNPNSNVLAYNGESARGAGGAAGAAGAGGAGGRALLRRAAACFAPHDSSDPEDDLPLNLSLHKN